MRSTMLSDKYSNITYSMILVSYLGRTIYNPIANKIIPMGKELACDKNILMWTQPKTHRAYYADIRARFWSAHVCLNW